MRPISAHESGLRAVYPIGSAWLGLAWLGLGSAAERCMPHSAYHVHCTTFNVPCGMTDRLGTRSFSSLDPHPNLHTRVVIFLGLCRVSTVQHGGGRESLRARHHRALRVQVCMTSSCRVPTEYHESKRLAGARCDSARESYASFLPFSRSLAVLRSMHVPVILSFLLPFSAG
jgi:hypothetical protein